MRRNCKYNFRWVPDKLNAEEMRPGTRENAATRPQPAY